MRSFAMASKMKALEIVSSKDSVLSIVIHALPNTSSPAAPGRSATMGVRNRNKAPEAENMKTAGQRDIHGYSPPPPELISCQPGISCNNCCHDQQTHIGIVEHDRKAANQQPKPAAGHQIDRLDRTPIENTRAGPGHCEGGE